MSLADSLFFMRRRLFENCFVMSFYHVFLETTVCHAVLETTVCQTTIALPRIFLKILQFTPPMYKNVLFDLKMFNFLRLYIPAFYKRKQQKIKFNSIKFFKVHLRFRLIIIDS